MKTQIRAARKPQRSFVPITPFEFESFEVRVGRVTRHRPFSIGVSYRKVNVRGVLKQFKTIPGPVNAVHHTKILLPSPSLQGHGLICSRLGRGRFVIRPRSLPGNSTQPLSILSPPSHERFV
jgi:hypothetical protein